MEYKVYTKEVELTEALENYIEKRMSKPDHLLKKHPDIVSPSDVRITKERGIYKVEITTHINPLSKIIKVEERSNDLYEAIDEVTDSLERKIRKLKNRLQEQSRTDKKARMEIEQNLQNPDIKNLDLAEENESEIEEKPDAPKIVRTKNFDLTLMSVEEAMLQMQLLGHSFFVFRNPDNDAISVLYERKDGDLGLIEFNE
ncbi:sigma 54 modulation protein/ribosomal protein S30EA [Petrotoga mobilis SJ95]|jgi:putative sigma-54 modulation protein|uniref:Ribosome hibernation promoting factor n=1 Tax=Petrotoga mobilis (strain DSM 10674 / SJ95) TaxID=403833 RepID=A9BI17_PETMO|nr:MULTISPECIES: ribosome-associated translation inhibitor RaiA [Petrotoga]ABX32132.1 sigma 54 modulation protein/ribosomal protein S30EA [Petrotoga mobilis SJ95]MBL5981456.1 30S ribosomal protein S30 [Petrotoga sp. 8T1HF07.NaAc.6.1]